MGQIQSAVQGAVSSIVGAQVAGELKAQREISALQSDINNTRDAVNTYNESESKFQRDLEVFENSDEMDEIVFNDWFEKANNNLSEQYKAIQGYRQNIDNRIAALEKGKKPIPDALRVAQQNLKNAEFNHEVKQNFYSYAGQGGNQ